MRGGTSLPDTRDSKALAISDSSSSILPTFYMVATEDYALSRRLYLYSPPLPENHYTRRFISYALSAKGQEIVNSNGFVDLNIKSFVPRMDTDTPVQDLKAYAEYLKTIKDTRRLSLNCRFKTGGTALDNRALRDLDRMVEYFHNSRADYKHIYMVGFADNRGDYALNLHLAGERARSVDSEFTARGLNAVTTLSMGEELSVSNNTTPEGREKNRRVDVWVE